MDAYQHIEIIENINKIINSKFKEEIQHDAIRYDARIDASLGS